MMCRRPEIAQNVVIDPNLPRLLKADQFQQIKLNCFLFLFTERAIMFFK
ncbi:hypothetical protein GCM10011351_16910 [Paraliobacillus quinghaiensis]|uniref:Uncharacterized protein n=1 Tax=Paraliobacillus quinghaiensis TaxID=470815 RepID=A0A917TPT2_9BACI|nr:hypothetical protein [Paraliobacillus quinghaiensis]GGM31401.1 hypothetical protein GCM10011351_16910 [Paraliobacillus quinghaiensis]